MKKQILLLILLSIFLSGCDFLNQLTCSHEYSVISQIEPTCSAYGIIEKKCELCGSVKKEKIEKTPHTFDSGTIIEATCSLEGCTLYKCINCSATKKENITNKLPHDYIKTIVEATCTEKGYTHEVCSVCSYEEDIEETPSLGHDLSDWKTVIEATDIHDGLRQKTCSRCDYTVDEIIVSTSYIDLSVIKYDFDSTKKYQCNSYDELLLNFNAALLSMSPSLDVTVNFEYSTLKELISKLLDDYSIPVSVHVSSTMKADHLTLQLTYIGSPSMTTPNVHYVQYGSVNYNPTTNLRSPDYEEFKINDSLYTYEVTTSDQLYYALERGVKPICVSGSVSERLYNEMKNVLRDIISDEMNDIQKLKAIYDYLVMNVTYDNDLLEYLYSGNTDLKNYNGFYLEGVFFDKKAVCEGISKALCSLANIEGIPAVVVTGYQTQNPSGAGHAWNKVNINGKWYIVDATSGGSIINHEFEVLTYSFFLISEEEYSSKYTADNFKNLECVNKINIFADSTFTIDGKTYDFHIVSQSEMNALVKYFESLNKTNYTIEFSVGESLGSSCLDEVREAYQINGIYKSYLYMDHGSTFILFS